VRSAAVPAPNAIARYGRRLMRGRRLGDAAGPARRWHRAQPRHPVE
jgi:hypothetical protein